MVARPAHSANTATPPAEVSQWMRRNAHRSWAQTDDRSARTAPARAALEQKWLDLAGGDTQKAASLRKAFYAELAAKSARARRLNRVARQAGE